MKYIEFKYRLKHYPVFSLKDIEKEFPEFDNRRLVEWQQKGYLQKIRRGYYCFSDVPKEEFFLYFTSNKIYTPSYISLETALNYYGVIPEAVFTFTAVCTRNTVKYSTDVGAFSYKSIKPNLFFGYQLIDNEEHTIKIAKLEKTVLDYLYFNSRIRSVDDFFELRWNKEVLKSMDFDLLNQYLQLFDSKALNRRIKQLIKYINA